MICWKPSRAMGMAGIDFSILQTKRPVGSPQQLAGALHVAASDVKVQVEVQSQTGHGLPADWLRQTSTDQGQFRDNTVDAAEIAAAESGNALYTVQINAGGEGPLGSVRVRYKLPGTTEYREQEWPCRTPARSGRWNKPARACGWRGQRARLPNGSRRAPTPPKSRRPGSRAV